MANYLILHAEDPRLPAHLCIGTHVHFDGALGVGDLFELVLFPGKKEPAEVFDIIVTPQDAIMIGRINTFPSHDEMARINGAGWVRHRYITSPQDVLVGISLEPLVDEIAPTGHWPSLQPDDLNAFANLGLLANAVLVAPVSIQSEAPSNLTFIDRWRAKRDAHSVAETRLC